jgi:glycine dehydrogenase subunit 2
MSDQEKLRNFHSASWDEPLLIDISQPGRRGIVPPQAESEIDQAVGDVQALLPKNMVRRSPVTLPELSQPEVVRHFSRLSQMTMGNDVGNDIGQGTCTLKYSPKINEKLAGLEQMTDIHPLQNERTAQGILEILYRTRDFMREISGMDEVSFQAGAGGQGVLTAACLMRAYHRARGDDDQRDQIITTIHSHPVDAASPATMGYEVLTVWNDEDGYPDLNAVRSMVSERTAGLFMTNPEDTGLFNPRIDEYVKLVHGVGGVCFTDQANLNGIIGKARARDAGFDMCHFNLHKTFSTPHGSFGPGCAAVCVSDELAPFLPVPLVTKVGDQYHLDFDRPQTIGRIKDFVGNAMIVLRAYAWVMSHGADGLREVAETAVINNNYLAKLLMTVPGVSMSYGYDDRARLDQVRFSWEKLTEDTGLSSEDLQRRMVDYGLQIYWTSHHPETIPQPFTPEPTESYSKQEVDEWAAVMRQLSKEAYETPDVIRTAPHNGVVTMLDPSYTAEAEKTCTTWSKWKRVTGTATG